jgi:hypothetical protein
VVFGWNFVPFFQTIAAARGCRVLCDKYRVVFHGCLLAVIRRIGGRKPFSDKISAVIENQFEPFGIQIFKLFAF